MTTRRIAALLVLLLLGAVAHGGWLHVDEATRVVYASRGYRAYHAKAYGDAEVLYRQALAASPLDEALHYNLGNALTRQGRRAEAVRHYRRALRRGGARQQAQVWANMAHAYYQMGQLAESFAAYRRALLLNQQDIAIRQDFLLVAHALHGPSSPRSRQRPKAAADQSPPAAEAQSPEAQTGADQRDEQAGGPEKQTLTAADMDAIFSNLAANESKARSNSASALRKKARPAHDQDY